MTAIVCTLNEEANVGKCLESLQWAHKCYVVDAGSTDATTLIARSLGAIVESHEWSGYSDQKNWALDNVPLDTDWVLFLDADELVPKELADEIAVVVSRSAAEAQHDGYYIARRMIFMGRWLKHAWWYPDYNLRLFLKDRGRFETRLVHESVIVQGSVGYLQGDIVHDDHRDIATYISRLNRYSSLEAIEMQRHSLDRAAGGNRLEGSLFGDRPFRRRFLKEHLWYRLPLRPVIRFVWTMIFHLGFLDGHEGLIFTLLNCVSDWHVNAKLYELRSTRLSGRPVSTAIPRLEPPTER